MFALLAFRVIEVGGVACLVGAGDTRTGLWVQGGVAVANVPLAWISLSRPAGRAGSRIRRLGAASASSACRWERRSVTLLAGIAVLTVLGPRPCRVATAFADFVPDAALLARLLRVSIPAAVDSLSIVGGPILVFAHRQPTRRPAGQRPRHRHRLGSARLSLGTCVRHRGDDARRPESRRPPAGPGGPQRLDGLRLGSGVMCAMGAVFYVLAPRMFWLFCQDPKQQPVIDVGVPVLRLIAFAMPALASTMIFTAALRGAGDTRVPVVFTWVGFLAVRIPLAYLLTGPADLGLLGAWLAMTADLYVRGAFFLWRFAGRSTGSSRSRCGEWIRRTSGI